MASLLPSLLLRHPLGLLSVLLSLSLLRHLASFLSLLPHLPLAFGTQLASTLSLLRLPFFSDLRLPRPLPPCQTLRFDPPGLLGFPGLAGLRLPQPRLLRQALRLGPPGLLRAPRLGLGSPLVDEFLRTGFCLCRRAFPLTAGQQAALLLFLAGPRLPPFRSRAGQSLAALTKLVRSGLPLPCTILGRCGALLAALRL